MTGVVHADLAALLVVLAVIAFALAIFAGFRGMIEAAVALMVIGVLILVFT